MTISEKVMALCESDILKRIDTFRQTATRMLDPGLRRERGQFLTPLPVAAFMAALFLKPRKELRLIDAGAGAGILSAATLCSYLQRKEYPNIITVTAFELEPILAEYLKQTYELCSAECKKHSVEFKYEIIERDFIEYAVSVLRADMFAPARSRFNSAIVNPPYAKIKSNSAIRRLLSSLGIETSNVYTAFLCLLAQLLDNGGELVAITPRSFCNGPYFRTFREQFFNIIALRRIHLFESRSEAFKDDNILQENIITDGVKTSSRPARMIISISDGSPLGKVHKRSCAYSEVMAPDDKDKVIHLTTNSIQADFRKQVTGLPSRLPDLELSVSTGRVVDFRARDFLRSDPAPDTVPLIYPCHFNGEYVSWPKAKGGRKPNAIVKNDQTMDLLVPSSVYVLVKRFTSKEEKRRVVACIYDPSQINSDFVGFENHLNYFHMHGKGLPMDLAKGLVAFLNSTAIDAFFRQFNGHTQVNASDLMRLHYPSRAALIHLGQLIGEVIPDQATLDDLIRKELVA